MNHHPAVGIGIAAVVAALCLTAIASDSSRIAKPAAVDADRYSDFVETEVFDIQDLAEGAEIQRRFFNRITPPGISLFQPMFPLLVPFDSKNFDDSFLDDLLGEDKNSVAIYPLSLALDPKTRETLVYNAEGQLIATIPSGKASRTWPEDADPSRVTLQLDLLPSEDIEPYLYTESRISESKTTPKRAAQRSLVSSEFGICNIQKLTNGNMRLTLTNGTDAAEVFAYTVLHTSSVVVVTWTNEETFEVFTDTNTLWTPVSPSFNGRQSVWEYAATNLALTNGIGVWVDANISSNSRTRFYAASKREDSDGDGLTDGAEILVHGTDPALADTDGDGLGDGEEVNDHSTSPKKMDSDNDGLDDGSEVHAYGTNPLSGDTDGDGMTDGWEIANGFNPLASADGAADADGDGLTNAAEQAAGTDPHQSDSDGDGIPDGTDSSPAMGNCLLPRELAWRLPRLDTPFNTGSTGSPVFGATVVCHPTGFVGNVIAITNITLRGVVDDAYMINGFCYEWSLGAKSFTRDITEAVTDRLTGRFSVDVYDYIYDCLYNRIGLMGASSTQGAECTYQYLVELMVELSNSQDWECWTAGGAYNVGTGLTTDTYTGNRVNWDLTRIAGSSASISTNGIVTLGTGGGQYRIRVSSSELSTCGDSMTLFVPKVDIQQTLTNVCWDCGCDVVLDIDPTSYSPGSYIWSSQPSGISGRGEHVTFNPSNLPPGTYTVRAQSASMPSCEDFCTVNVLKVDTIDVTSPKSGTSANPPPNPPPFEGHKSWPFDVTHSPNPDKHMVVFYKDVVDSSFNVQDFDMTLKANILPTSISVDQLNEIWAKISGPGSGSFDRTDTFEVKYQNPKLGGVYRFDFDLGLNGCAKSEANVVLPLAGADVDNIVSADIGRANTFAAMVLNNYSWIARQNPLNGARWFVTNGAGDYLGRPNNSSSPTVWAYNQVDANGFAAVGTWKGKPIRVAKISNFMVGYGARKIGVSSAAAWVSQVIGTWNDSSSSKSWDAGWNVGGGASYDTTVAALVADIWDEDNDPNHKNMRLWPNASVTDDYVAPNSFYDPDHQFTSPGFLYMTNP